MHLIPNSDSVGEFGLHDEPEVDARPVRECDASGECARCRKKRLAKMKEKGGGEIHSAKAHRCVDKVKAKGHGESSAWAICTTSIGKAGTYAKGHGGSASPKRKVKESNDCHNPGGPGGGRFCAGSGGGAKKGRTTANDMLNQQVNYGGVMMSKGAVMADLRKQGASQAMIDRYMQGLDASARQRAAYPGRTIGALSPVAQKLSDKWDARMKKMDADEAKPGFEVKTLDGKSHEVKTLNGYDTPYYYSQAHGGPAKHFSTLKQLKGHIERTERKRTATKMKASGAFKTL